MAPSPHDEAVYVRQVAALRRLIQGQWGPALERAARQLFAALQSGGTSGIEVIAREQADEFAGATTLGWLSAGQATGEWVGRQTKQTAVFDPSDPAAAEILRQERVRIQQSVQLDQLELMTLLAAGAFGAATRQRIANSVGLSVRGAQAVANYEQLLRAGSAAALQRELRNRREDPRVLRAVSGSAPLSEAEIRRMTAAYATNAKKSRLLGLADGEARAAVGSAMQAAYRQFIALGLLPAAALERVWIPRVGGNRRDFHQSMRGQRRPFGVPFVSGRGALLNYPRDPSVSAVERANCKCRLRTSVNLGALLSPLRL